MPRITWKRAPESRIGDFVEELKATMLHGDTQGYGDVIYGAPLTEAALDYIRLTPLRIVYKTTQFDQDSLYFDSGTCFGYATKFGLEQHLRAKAVAASLATMVDAPATLTVRYQTRP